MTIDNATISVVKTINPPIPASTQLFASNFKVSISAFATGGRASFSGTDTDTGYVWPFSGGGSNQALKSVLSDCLLINNYVSGGITAANAGSYGRATIRDAVGAPGEKELFLELLDSGAIDRVDHTNQPFGAQLDLEFSRIQDGMSPLPPDFNDLYVSHYFKFPASIATDLAVGGYTTIFDIKSGGYTNLYNGDNRITVGLIKGADGNLYTRTDGDRNANGSVIATSPDGILPWVYDGTFSYWRETFKSFPITLDAWHKFEIYIHRDAKNGICLVSIDDTIVCYHVGRTLGEFGLPWGRIFPFLIYGNHGPGKGSVRRLRVHDYPPNGSALQLPAASLLYRYG
ncbi:hypothetical protein [Nitrosomonas oligotropha]|uniref:Concanavalin A-like lectin/glucanase superfamily protein n=1 Tax=Nitrosomonas oligotropha TaxID=42354 RepID=A0A1H8TCT8_9PROT|nr:hypothetical protein [Nitrosomonas oligotropha]SDX24219.1 hypothetical protein SAMN05216300_12437 [Nitrosomonas oligotropha]SEO88318.1 hypothetical protein SAMN05216333_12337 [Nitrosomonas oligotropha]